VAFAAAVVLAGGRSLRMGSAKASLEWHGSTLLRRVTGVVARAVDGPVVVVRSPGQALPPLAAAVEVRTDPAEGLGPMQGLGAGLAAVAGRADVAFVSSTDLPFLHSAFVSEVLSAFGAEARGAGGSGECGAGGCGAGECGAGGSGLPDDCPDVVLPVVRGFWQPLAAAYRTSLLPVVEELVRERTLRMGSLLERCGVLQLDERDLLGRPGLAAVDPDLDAVLNVNDPDAYRAARARPAPAVRIEVSWDAAGPAPAARHAVRDRTAHVATLAGAAAVMGMGLAGGVDITVNGRSVEPDGELPLLAGDRVRLRTAGQGHAPG
jgi:molybdenum cofactor guanylyltransferase